VHDDVSGGGGQKNDPRAFGVAEKIFQRFSEQPVLRRDSAAVAVDERPPMRRRVEDVPHFERHFAERQLEQRRRRRQMGDVMVNGWNGVARFHERRERR